MGRGDNRLTAKVKRRRARSKFKKRLLSKINKTKGAAEA